MHPPQGSDVSYVPRLWCGATAIYAVAFIGLAWPWLSGAVTIPWDAKSQFFPQQVFLARSLARGDAPFWTDNVFAGWPQISDPQSLIFSPLHLLLALVSPTPSFQAVDGVSFAALFLGGLGIILIFRDRSWHPAGAVVAALAFAMGGSCAARLQHTGQVMSIAYLPLALWLAARAVERGSWRAGAGFGLVVGLIALGRDQVALLGLYLLAAYTLMLLFGNKNRGPRLRASVVPLTAAGVAAIVVAAVPLMMTALLALESNRPAIDYEGAGRGSLHPAHLLTLLFADLYGATDATVPYWGPASFPWGSTGLFLAQNMGQLYAAALTIVAIVGVGIVRGAAWAREVRFFTIAAIVLALYALGWYTPVFRLFYELVWGVALFRRPADATFLLGALLAIVGGYCVHRLLAGMPRWTLRQVGLASAIGAALAAVAVALAVNKGMVAAATLPITSALIWVAAAIGALALSCRLRRHPMLTIIMLAVVATADLAWNNGPNESTGLPPATYDALRADTGNETVALLKTRLGATAGPDRRDRIELTGIGYHWPNLGLVHDLDSLFGHNPLRLKDFALATGVDDTVAVPDQRTFAPLFPSYRSAMADLFGLRFVATGMPVEQIDPKLKAGDLVPLARTADAFVYENPRALPRVMLITDWRQADFLVLLRDGWPTEIDPARTVLLESPPDKVPSGNAAGSVRILRYANTEIIIDVETPVGGFLVVNDIWHPWWTAEVDGVRARILKANVLFRAVALAPGSHRVRLEFRPFASALRQAVEKIASPFTGQR